MSSTPNDHLLQTDLTQQADYRTEILFILDNLPNVQTLAAATPAGSTLVLLDGSGNALQQMADYLAALPPASVDAIHLLSHGSEGSLQLGSLTLTADNLNESANVLRQIGSALTEDGDILLYGCNVAEGDAGMNFIGRLAQITGADIAASSDATGAADLGGDWVLEYSPEVESRPLGTQGELAGYAALLALPVGEQNYDLSTFTDEGLVLENTYFTVSGSTSGANPAGMSNDGGAAYVDGASSTDATTTVTIKVAADASDLASFELTNINLSDFDGIPTTEVQNLQIIGHKADGTGTVSSGTVNGTADDDTFVSASFPTWGNFSGVQLDYYEITWSFNNGGGFTALDIDFISFSVTNMTGPNSAPVLTNLSGDSATFTEDGSAVLLDTGSNAMVSDADSADFNGGHVTVSIVANRVSGEDVLAVRHEGTGAGQIGVSGSSITYGGTVIGTFTGGTSTNDLVITFNSVGATPQAAQALIRNLTYANTNSGNPSTSNRTVRVTVNDGDGGSTAADVTVGITAINDDPAVAGLPASITVTEDISSNADLSTVTFADVDSAAGNVSLTIAAGTGTLAATSGGSVTIGGSGTGTITLTGTAANIDTFLNTASNIKYTGAANASGNNADTLTLTANDGGNTGTGGGSDVSLGTVSVNITAVNDAPVLDNSGAMTLTSVTEDDANPAGDTVADIIASAGGDRITDVDGGGAVEGIAITGLTGDGTWQYSTNGIDWTNFGAVTSSFARLLTSTNSLRFVPTPGYNNAQTATVTFRAWDQTSGTAGSTADTTTNGGTTAFSTTTETAAIIVTAVNDTPTISAGSSTAFTEQTATAIAPAISLSDPDGDTDWNGGTLKVQITANASADDSLRLPTTNGGGIWVDGIGSNTLYSGAIAIGTANASTVSNTTEWAFTFNANATNALVQEVARSIQFGNDSDDPATANRTITFTVADASSASASASQTVTVTPLNDAPEVANRVDPALTFSGEATSYAEFADNDASVTDQMTLEVWVKFSDLEDVQFIAGKAVEQMELHTNANALRFIPTGGVYVDTGAVLVVDQWTHIAASYDANTDVSEIYINGVKVASVDNNAAADEALKSTADNYRLGIRGDNTYPLNGAIAEYRIWNSIRTADEIRDYMNVSLQGNEANLVSLWKLDEAGGTTLADSSANHFDGTAYNAGWISRPVSGGLAVSYSEGAAPVAVFSDTSVTTIESGQHIRALTLTVTNVSDATEYLHIDGSNVALAHATSGTTAGNIGYSVSVADGTAIVSLTHAGLTEEQTAALINGISYSNSSQTPTTASPRVVSLTAMQDDGGTAGGGSDSAVLSLASTVALVDVNDPPALTATGQNPTYAPGGAAATLFSATAIDPVETGQNITALTLTVTNVTEGAAEMLQVDGTSIALSAGTSGTTAAHSFGFSVAVDGTTATVTLSKTDTVANWQTLVDGLRYQNTSDNPTTSSNRLVTITSLTDDGGTAAGGVDSADISIASTVTFGMPSIDSATYDWASGQLVLSGQNFVAVAGAANDVVASLLTFTGEGGSYSLTDTANVEITSSTSATLTLSDSDQLNIRGLLNKNGTVSSGTVTYNLAAADNWLAGSPTGSDIADAVSGITVSHVAVPTITSASYDSDTGILSVTGTNLFSKIGAANDIDISALTFTGGIGNATYTLTSGTDVEITSATSFTVTLSGTDKTNVDALLDQIGTTSSGGTTYNLAAADDWLAGADTGANIADASNAVTVSIAPKITSATYNASTGALIVTGSNIQANGEGTDIDASAFTLTGEGGATYRLTNTADVERDSFTQFTLTLSAQDRAAINPLVNKNGTTSTGGTTFNLAAADDWCTSVTTGDSSDATNAVTVSSVPAPAITSATYDAATGMLVVTGTGLLKLNGATNDIVANKFTFTGEGGATYTLTDSANVEITSGTAFTLTLSATDKAAVSQIINKNGSTSTNGTPYNLAAAEDWAAGADAAINIADLAGNPMNVSNVPVPTITSATYDSPTNVLTVTGTGFITLSGAANDIDASKFTLRGEGGATYTLTDTADVEISSATTFSLTLSATDSAAVELLLNKEGTLSNDNTSYNLAAAEDWARGADAAVTIADLAGNGVTVTLNSAPVITSNNGDDLVFISISENTTAVTTVQATDADAGDTLTYSLSGGADQARFQIDSATGVLSFISAPNFEAPTDADGNNTYVVEVTVDDGNGGTDGQTLTVSVTDVNEAPVITSNGGGATATVNVAENSSAVTWVEAIDDEGDSLTYSISGGADAASFSIDGATGALRFVSAPNFESPTDADSNNSYLVDVSVSNPNGGTALQALAVTVTNVNEAPVITSGATASLPENAPAQSLVMSLTAADPEGDALSWQIGGQDATLFSFDLLTGALRLAASPDFEVKSRYELSLSVSDGQLSDTQLFTLSITDSDEAPVLSANTGRTLNEGGTIYLSNVSLLAQDAETGPEGLFYQLTALPTHGNLLRDTEALTLGERFSQTDVAERRVAYVHDHSDSTSDSFAFSLSDGTHLLEGQFSLTIVPVDDTPTPEPEPTLPPQDQWEDLPDDDGDGVPELVEAFVPGLTGDQGSSGDGNGDGVADTLQSDVTSVPFRTTNRISEHPDAPETFVTLVADSVAGKPSESGSALRQVQQLDAPLDLPEGIDMPLGQIGFTAEIEDAGAVESFSLYVDGDLRINGYWKQDADGDWANLASSAYGGQMVREGDRLRLDFVIEDGGEFDADGLANGVIVDPGAAGYVLGASVSGDQNAILQLCQAMFAAAPGEYYLSAFEDYLALGNDLTDLANALASTWQFEQLMYDPLLSDLAFCQDFVDALVGEFVSAEQAQEAVDYLDGLLMQNWSRAEVMVHAAQGLSTLADFPVPEWALAATYFNHQVAAAAYFSEDLRQSAFDLAQLQRVTALAGADGAAAFAHLDWIDGWIAEGMPTQEDMPLLGVADMLEAEVGA